MKQQQEKQLIFSFFGPPGSGKGTLAKQLVQNRGFQVLSTGNLCRQHVATGTAFGKMLDGYLTQGKLIPDELITDMVIDWLKAHADPLHAIILDGFPRTEGQARRFAAFLEENNRASTFCVVLIEIPDDEIVRRLSQRLVCSNKKCQAPFTAKQDLTNCTFCNEPLIKRNDDQEHVVRERLGSYHLYRDALLEYYVSAAKLPVVTLDITGQSPVQVYEHFEQACLRAG